MASRPPLEPNKILKLNSDVFRKKICLFFHPDAEREQKEPPRIKPKKPFIIDQLNFAQTHGWLRGIFKPDFKSILFQCMAVADQDAIEAIIQRYPELLLMKGRTQNHTGQPMIGTIYQIAAANKDIHMMKMLQPYFEKIKKDGKLITGKAEMQKQIEARFPNGWIEEKDEAFKKHWKPAHAALDHITEILLDAHPNELQVGNHQYDVVVNKRIQDEFDQFEKVLFDITRSVGEIGFHFDEKVLQKALEYYKYIYASLAEGIQGNYWNSPKNMFFCQRVIGTIEKYLPPNYLQAFATGIRDIANKKRGFMRTFEFQDDKGYFILPLNSNADWALGKNYRALVRRGCGARRCPWPGHVAGLAAADFQLFVNQQQQLFRTYADNLNSDAASCEVIGLKW